MKSWIVTGGIASGKSAVRQRLALMCASNDVHTFSADEAAHSALSDPAIISALVDEFGDGIAVDGVVDREWIRLHVLPEDKKKRMLESIVHPRVFRILEQSRHRAEQDGANLFLAEVPLHYEIGATVSADFVIVVASSRSVQVRRMMETRGLDEQTVRRFLEAQWPIEAKVERADAVIWNDGSFASLDGQLLTLARTHLQA